MDNKTRKFWRYIIKHALWFGLLGLVITGAIYLNILGLRNALAEGYFSNPALTTLSEITFWLMGGFIGIIFGSAIGIIKHSIYKKKKKR